MRDRRARMTCPSLRHAQRARPQVLRRVRHAARRRVRRLRHARIRPPPGSAASAGRPSPRRPPESPARGGAAARSPPAPRPAAGPIAERRLVTVLFADLVGFTALSEGRDPEAVRELLSRYFELATDVIERYGGTVEKFIGDAVMAVWGAPVAHEDDAERAVRAASTWSTPSRALGPRDPGPLRRAHRRGRGHARRDRTRGWSPATSSTPPPASSRSRPPGAVLVGESTQQRDERRDRVRGGRRAAAQGQGRAGPGVAGPARRGRAPRPRPRRPPRGAVRRPRHRSCACSRTCSTRRRASAASGSCPSPARPASARAASRGSS